MRPVRLTQSVIGVSDPVVTDIYTSPFSVSIAVVLSAAASMTYTVQYTYDDVFSTTFNPSTAAWFTVSGFSPSKTASADGQITFPVMAVRLNITAYTSGSATLTVIQAGTGN